jgi:hypothetical protein
MWRYFREKYCSPAAAVRGQYPEALNDPLVAGLIAQIEGLEAALDRIMAERHPCETDDD